MKREMTSDMKRTATRWSVVAAAALVLASAAPARAQKINPNDRHVQELIREAAARAGVTTSGVPAAGQATAGANGRPQVRLTLDDAIKLALDRNLDIAVQRLNPEATLTLSIDLPCFSRADWRQKTPPRAVASSRPSDPPIVSGLPVTTPSTEWPLFIE